MSALVPSKDGVVVRVYVQPKAHREKLMGMHSDRLKVAVTEPPDRGRANAALLRLLAQTMGIAVSSVELLRGDTSRNKDILLRGQTCDVIADRLRHGLSGNAVKESGQPKASR